WTTHIAAANHHIDEPCDERRSHQKVIGLALPEFHEIQAHAGSDPCRRASSATISAISMNFPLSDSGARERLRSASNSPWREPSRSGAQVESEKARPTRSSRVISRRLVTLSPSSTVKAEAKR